MRRLLTTTFLVLFAITAAAQEEPKTGWVFTPMPDVSYNSDIGLNLGGFCDFFYYGDGTDYPNFQHHIAVCGAWATKGSWYLHGLFDSKTLVPGARVTGSLTYRDASMFMPMFSGRRTRRMRRYWRVCSKRRYSKNRCW